jgi:hypothetical protein
MFMHKTKNVIITIYVFFLILNILNFEYQINKRKMM